jgi:hypothetical protein
MIFCGDVDRRPHRTPSPAAQGGSGMPFCGRSQRRPGWGAVQRIRHSRSLTVGKGDRILLGDPHAPRTLATSQIQVKATFQTGSLRIDQRDRRIGDQPQAQRVPQVMKGDVGADLVVDPVSTARSAV